MIFKKQAPKILVTGILLCLFSFNLFSQEKSYLNISEVLDEVTITELLNKRVLRNFSVNEKEKKLIYQKTEMILRSYDDMQKRNDPKNWCNEMGEIIF